MLISRAISRELHYDLSILIAKSQRNKNCTLFLTTLGGDPDGGYRIARCLQHYYEHIRVVIPSLCKSAGTLVVIGANEVVIGDLGELGPLDIQLRKPTELEERGSGLDIIQALEAAHDHIQHAFHRTLLEIRRGGRLSTRLAGEFAARLAVGVAAPLYSQIDPNRLGETQRAMRIAHEYGQRLNQRCNALRDGALENLVASYPSHSFVIDRKEAAELFTNVQAPSMEENDFCCAFWYSLGEQSGQGPMYIRSNDEKDNDRINQDDYPTTTKPSDNPTAHAAPNGGSS